MGDEIVIAGAGVAGLTAAINLKRAGRAVRVIERSRASGAQRFPDWDAIENWTAHEDVPTFLQRIGIEDCPFRYVEVCNFSVIDPHGRRHEVHTRQPFFYLVKRGAIEGGLEGGLQRQAAAMGVTIEYGRVCPPRAAHIWAGGTFGQSSRFVTVGFTFQTNHPNWVCGLVDKRIAPRAYAYLAIAEGAGTVAVVLTEGWQQANRLLEQATAIFRQHGDIKMHNRHKSGGSGGDLAAFWKGRDDFVIGEAAGFQDFLWGFGIRHALTSGYLAAQSIIRGQDWQTLADAEIRPLVRASLVNRWMYDRMPNWFYAWLIRRFASDPNLNATVSRWYHPRAIHRLLWPLAARHFQGKVGGALQHERYRNRTRAQLGPGMLVGLKLGFSPGVVPNPRL